MLLQPETLIGEKYLYPFSFVMIDAYGKPEPLKGTDNDYFYAYFPKGEFTMISSKKTDEIIHILDGRAEGPYHG